MKNQKILQTVLRLTVLGGLIFLGTIAATQPAEAAQSAADYCGQYTSNSLKNACKAGLNKEDCSDYAVTFDQATADICTKAAKDLADGTVTKGDVEVTSSPSPSPSSSSNSGSGSESKDLSNFNLSSLQDILDQSKTLTDFIDVLHKNGPDSKVDTSGEADDNPGYYINGAGKKQPINVSPSGKPNSPAIIWFNGGGWHANDGTAAALATGSTWKNGISDSRNTGSPAGGGANARGYTVIEVTYRLGSSGVYYMFEDVMRGIQHVRDNAALYNIDPSKLVVGGDSAGGSLAMRAVATGKSGAKAGVGWSAPTNAYTALFKSYKSLFIGMDHSTCIPTDLAGLTNFTDLLNGGSGDVAEYGQGLSSNDFSSLGINSGSSGVGFDQGGIGLNTLTEILTAGQYAMKSSQNVESISQQLEGGGSLSGMSGSLINLSSKKLIECIDNFNVLSPALFASPETPPTFNAEFETDDVIDPQQSYDMRDKVRSLGGRAETLILPGDADAGNSALAPSENHLGYDSRFVCATLNFLNDIVQPDAGQVDCKSGVADNQGSNDIAAAGGSGGQGSSGGSAASPGSPSGSSPGGNACSISATVPAPNVGNAAGGGIGSNNNGNNHAGSGTGSAGSNLKDSPSGNAGSNSIGPNPNGNSCTSSGKSDGGGTCVIATSTVRYAVTTRPTCNGGATRARPA